MAAPVQRLSTDQVIAALKAKEEQQSPSAATPEALGVGKVVVLPDVKVQVALEAVEAEAPAAEATAAEAVEAEAVEAEATAAEATAAEATAAQAPKAEAPKAEAVKGVKAAARYDAPKGMSPVAIAVAALAAVFFAGGLVFGLLGHFKVGAMAQIPAWGQYVLYAVAGIGAVTLAVMSVLSCTNKVEDEANAKNAVVEADAANAKVEVEEPAEPATAA